MSRRNLAATLAVATVSVSLQLLAPTRSFAHQDAAAPNAPATAASSDIGPAAVERDAQKLAAVLSDPAAAQVARDEVARRLLARTQTPNDPRAADARQALLTALVDPNPGGQIAVARAIAGWDDPSGNPPDPAYVNPLFAAMGSNRAAADDAAAALAMYRNSPTVLSRLRDIANARRPVGAEAPRIAAIKALGAFPEKRVAETLVRLLRDTEESIGVRNKAADALSAMTGITSFNEDAQLWENWWRENAGKSDVAFHNEMNDRKANLASKFAARADRLVMALKNSIRGQLQIATDPAQRQALLVQFLRAPEAEIREVAARQTLDDFQSGSRSQPIVEQLRLMIGDSDASVRRAVIESLAKMNDRESVDSFITQLAREADPNMRAQMARALGIMLQPRAVPTLIRLLKDDSRIVARAAAGALAYLQEQKVLKPDSPQANEMTAMLNAIVERSGDSSADADLRVAAIEALVPLKRAELLRTLYYRLLNPQLEPPRVRVLALRALGEIGDPQSANTIIDAFNDSDDSVREAAIKALGGVSPSPAQLEALKPFLDQSARRAGDGPRDPSLDEAAWSVMQLHLPSVDDRGLLTRWADWFRNDPNRQIIVRKRLVDVLTAARALDDLATVQKQIGDNYIALNDPESAVAFYHAALDLREGGGAPGRRAELEDLVRSHLGALLKAHRYPDSISFAVDAVGRDPGRLPDIGAQLVNDVEQLRSLDTAESLKLAQQLIDATKKMKPDLPERHRDALDELRRQVDKRIVELSRPRGSYLPIDDLPFMPCANPRAVMTC